MLLKELMPHISAITSYEYSEIQTAETENFINDKLSKAPSVQDPVLYHMLGIPGAGKSTFYRRRYWEPHLFIDFDAIMKDISAYQEDVFKLGSVEAFQRWEMPARVIGYELLRRAIEERKNIFLDHGGAFQGHVELLKNIPKLGYKTEMFYIRCDLQTALQRAILREKRTNRHTPPQIIEQRYKILEELSEQYKQIAHAFYVYENQKEDFELQLDLSKYDIAI